MAHNPMDSPIKAHWRFKPQRGDRMQPTARAVGEMWDQD
jgi:hypothetical protein